MCAKDREFLYMVRYVCHINQMHCARFSLEADKMGIFVIEILLEALLLKIIWQISYAYFRIHLLRYITVHCPWFSFLGEFVKLRKATNSFVMSCHVCPICPSAWNNCATTGRIFVEIWYLNIFRKSVEKFRILLKYDKNNGHLSQ